MSSLDKSIDSTFNDLKRAIASERGKDPTSQGINAYIAVYPPKEEKDYLTRAKKDYSQEYIIDLSDLFVELIDEYGLERFKTSYNNFRSTPSALFINQSDENIGLMDLIRRELKAAEEADKKPILIRTGILYGTHIRNKSILEDDQARNLDEPLIIFYPGITKEDMQEKKRIWFLGVKKASDYRGEKIY